MSKKSKVNKAQWTNFWNALGIYVKKPSRFLRKYKNTSDIKRLRKIGVSDTDINKVLRGFSSYQEPDLQFHKFSSFFRKDSQTVLSWTGKTNISEAFLYLFRKLHFNNFSKAKTEFSQLFFLYELNKKGEGRAFEIKFHGRGSIDKIQESMFSGLLSSKHENASYSSFKKFKIGKYTLIPFLKDGQGKKVYKFLRFIKEGNKILVDISADSQKEINLLKYKISDYFNSFLDVPEANGSFDKLLNFLKTGESTHYKLIGINFFDNSFKVSIFPQHNRIENVAKFNLFKQKFSSATQAEIGKIVDIRVANNEITTKNQVFIRFYTYLTEGIIGALTLSLDDRRLNMTERKKLKADFTSDFELPLNTLINFESITEEEIYKSFLQNLPQKQKRLQLRSEASLNIYKRLLQYGLISLQFESKDSAGYCFNKDCRMSFQRRWNQKICQNCKDPLFSDKKIIVSKIEEKNIAEFLYTIYNTLGFTVEKFEKRLLGRKIYAVEVRKDKKSACLIPITKTLNDNQLEVLRFRYPNVVLVTSKDDTDELKQGNIEVLELYKLVMKLSSSSATQFTNQLINKVFRNRLTFIRSVADECATRLINDQFYKDKNKIVKNFGAELFEADTSVVLSYIFGNSIWLGANKRGKEFPDGITALPLTTLKNGCFVWDTKFSETGRIVFGSESKNRKYIEDGKKNKTIISNGGLKGFMFISNANPPVHFSSKFGRLVIKRKIKISIIKTTEIAKIYNHFKDYETDINNNSRVKEVFIESMKKLLFKTTKATKAFVLKEQVINNLTSKNLEKYQELGVAEIQAE